MALLGATALGVLYWMIAPTLPSVATLREVQLQVPLRVETRDGRLIANFGEMRRIPVRIDDIPDCVKHAFLAAEDARFYEHPGIDWRGIFRAAWMLGRGHEGRVPGGSTITQQVARNFFLSSEYKLKRKAAEILLALRIERNLSKDEILELYLNKIFLGHRSYGIAAAADFYYGKRLADLTLPECAMLAALPKFPSTGNPITRPERALVRRNYVLDRMLEVGYINASQHAAAMAEPERARPHESPAEVDAPYLAEMVRQDALERLGERALTDGYVVVTSIDGDLQQAANAAVREGILDYDQRHGYRGPEAQLDLAGSDPALRWRLDPLAGRYNIAGLHPALVVEVGDDSATLEMRDGRTVSLDLEGVRWAREYRSVNARGPEPRRMGDVLAPGDVVRVVFDNENRRWRLSQMPAVQSALASIDSRDGAIRSLVGGFSFALNKFNRATQSARPPGSSFKPFVYSAAFERGFNPGSLVNDAPVALPDPSQPDGWWRPGNDDGRFMGPMRLRDAMVRSRNLVSVRLLEAIGAMAGRDYILKFGFSAESMPPNLSLALGTSAVAPLHMARGYATFINGGKLVDTWYIDRILDRDGQVVFQVEPLTAREDCGNAMTPSRPAPQAIDPRNAYIMVSLLQDVVNRGTGSGAKVLGRTDLGGKTGTTNDFRDVWFSGFGGDLVTTVWVGFDDFTSLGPGEFASRTALPIWIQFMRTALEGVPEREWTMPDGLVRVAMNPLTGALAENGEPGAIAELVRREDIDKIRHGQGILGGTSAEEEAAYDIF
ncbi:penicillin-binding protein [Pseudofulvimonas gallinarii]|uniref:Penicillin-binding protein 1A n=2 Tax=Pseudofulvimonas gallinarii TaxID=634155 RepID=A0A4S3KXR7_9GAMM|nr:penicillin-binding protein 1A [Pseudofulvimonas gallinarii]TCT00316.1 penicillin-binding protein 1A [Pseudofulvimonas gallinarii]THD14157.1 penicillin-binding protein [Pseudofulvimonas gallinarii]